MLFSMRKPELVVVNDFYDDPDEVRKFALAQEYHDSKYHKGKSTAAHFLFPGLKERFEMLLHRKITSWETYGRNGVFQYCIAGDTLVYHSDLQSFAGAIYLTPDAPPETGTTFFRSKEFGLDHCPNDQEAQARGFENAGAMTNKMYGGRLLDKTAWTEIDRIGNVYNRLALWAGNKVHSASDYFGHSKESGRLFQIFFFDAE